MNTDPTVDPSRRPALSLLGAEPWRAACEFLVHKSRRVRRRKPWPRAGDGHPIVVFPGLASDGRVVGPLRDHCRALGYEAIDWGQGFNTGPEGDHEAWLGQLARSITGLLQQLPRAAQGQAPTLIGWSLGGIYARELAKRSDFPVRQVITIGTPFNGSSDQTHAGWLYKLLNRKARELAPAHQQRLSEPPPVPTTSIYSRSDGIVAWQACRHDQRHRQVQEIEVAGSHLGMGWNEEVLAVVTERLAAVPARRLTPAATDAAR